MHLRYTRYLLVFLALFVLASYLRFAPLDRHRPLQPIPVNATIFVATILWNSAEVLPVWTAAVLQLAAELGPERVFVSIYESGSWDKTKALLTNLDTQLAEARVPHRIQIDDSNHADAIHTTSPTSNWVRTPQNKWELRRIPFLARARNRALAPLHETVESRYSHVLFLNDISFTPQDVYTLLSTNAGHFAAACALDYKHPQLFYDTFALRDSDGHSPLQSALPYFRSSASRRALVAGRPVPVQSCWNGMAIMESFPFYSHNLAFRGLADSMAQQRLEASECCLIHVDNPLSSTLGVFVNAAVRVAYSLSVYDEVNHPNWLRQATKSFSQQAWRFWWPWQRSRVRRKIAAWKNEDPSHDEAGDICIIEEMQVLRPNGWAHV